MNHKKISFEIANRALVAACFVAIAAQVSWAQIRPPASGYVLDPRSHAVRPVTGLPGAWVLGSPLNLGAPVSAARFAVNHDFALIASGGRVGHVAVWQSLNSAAPMEVAIPGTTNPDVIVLNDSETAALLYSRKERSIQWITGLPGQAAIARTMSLSTLPGDVTALALNSAGNLALFGLTSGALYRVPLGDDPQNVGNVAASSIVFAANDRDAYVADTQASQILLATDPQGLSLVADGSTGIDHPGTIQIAGSTNLLIAGAGTNKVVCLDTVHGVMSNTAPLPFGALRMDRFGSTNAFLLNQPGDGPLYILDAGAANALGCSPTLLFVPGEQGAVRLAQ